MTVGHRDPREQAVTAAVPQQLPSGHVSDHLRWLRSQVPAVRLFAPRVALLIPSADGERVVVDGSGALPWADVELETSLSDTGRALAVGLGLAGTASSTEASVAFEPVAAFAGVEWWEDSPEVGALAPVWIVVRAGGSAPGGPALRTARLASVPLAVAALARQEGAAATAGVAREVRPDPPTDEAPRVHAAMAGGGDYIHRVRHHIGTARIFYPWAGMALRDADGRLLLVRLAEQEQWHCPGGGMEVDEAPESTAARELAEETGLVGRPGRLIGCFSRHARSFVNGDRIQGVAIFLEGNVDAGRLRPDPTGEIDQMGWFAADELPPLQPPWDSRAQLVLTGQGARFD